jgi:polysaccharide export outer membrane protein
MSVSRLFALFSAIALLLPAPTGARADEYLLQPGDILSLMIVGAPELSRAIPVEMDGIAWFPIVGEVAVGGSSLREVRARVAEAYAATSIDPAGIDGVPDLVRPSQVYVAVEDYRPIYLTSDVMEPRTIEFTPGLTLRQAIALASTTPALPRAERPVAESLQAAEIELSRAYARVWSLKTRLGRDTPADYQNIFVADSEPIREIARLETAMVEASGAERAQQRRVIAESIKRAESRQAVLEEQRASEAESLQLDEQAAAEVRELFERGSPLAPASRLAEARRAALVSASRVLELEVAVEDVRTELAGLHAQAATLDSGAESATWSELSDAVTLAQEKRAELAALQAAGLLGARQDQAEITITRGGRRLPRTAPDATDQPLQPGDVIEIILARPEGPSQG